MHILPRTYNLTTLAYTTSYL